MRNKLLLVLFFILTLASCKEESATYGVCKYETSNPQLQVYNDLLIELVENEFYYLYLGEKADVLKDELDKLNDPDSVAAFNAGNAKLQELKQEVAKDTSGLKTIYISHKNHHKYVFDEFIAALWGRQGADSPMRQMLRKYDADSSTTFLRLHDPQLKYSASDFQACTFKVGSLEGADLIYELEPEQIQNAIGQVSLSEIQWNKQRNKGVLYYEFFCSTKCGKGELIEFENVNGRWRISERTMLWIS
ncbi:hypothetical protein [Pontibacter chinhatensis]|uniref:Uncharacterized protein n=1 Tax=Pontibacter chinhatensis TaxID=1436961 RepID=A0A1I2UC91_9BACT|nr:hypothetical protein [Pontibacter chinhatensis]SFG74764.1 hypothetical protein SAMN05421739_103483 [Pontibacter chinhatensis]